MSIEQSLQKYKNQELKNIESLIIELAILCHHDHLYIIKAIESIVDIDKSNLYKVIDAHKLLVESKKIDIKLQELLKNSVFIDNNPSLILSLAKLFFQADKIELVDQQIIISKEIKLPHIHQEIPKIDDKKIIHMLLKKVKYNRLQNKDLKKIDQLQAYDQYKNLHQILLKAIDTQTLIQTLNDDELSMTYNELKEFLDN